MLESPLSDLVCLRVRERQFIGQWQAVQNIIVITPRKVLRQLRASFKIPVNHLQLNGTSNRFQAVEFYQSAVLQLIDTLGQVPAKTIRQYTADTAELSDAHVDLLVMAIVTNGCCKEPPQHRRNQNMYRR